MARDRPLLRRRAAYSLAAIVTLPALFTPAEAAKRLRVTAPHVRKLIAAGKLVAFDLRAEGAPRPRWVIPEPELIALLISRASSDASSALKAMDAHLVASATVRSEG